LKEIKKTFFQGYLLIFENALGSEGRMNQNNKIVEKHCRGGKKKFII